MIESLAPAKSRRAPRRWLAWIFTLVGCCGLLFRWGWVQYKWHLDELEYREAIEEADRLDPGWRLADLEAGRTVVPDSENSAFQVIAAHRLLPKNWFPPPTDSSECLEYMIDDLLPVQCLNEKQSQELSDELEKVSEAVLAARRLAEMPRGRYEVVWSNPAIFTPLPHLDDIREVSRLLWLDAVRSTQRGDIGGALTSCRALLNTGRSVGDEPAEVSQILRMACRHPTVKSLERTLGQGRASEAPLAAVQRLLEDEVEQPLLLIAARGERGTWHQFLEVLKAGEFDRDAQGWLRTRRSKELDDLLDKKRAHASHGACLKCLTECVEIRKLPLQQQFDRPPRRSMPRLEDFSTVFDGPCYFEIDPLVAYSNRLALLRCSITAVAVERYRLGRDCWPDRLEDLVPRYLRRIPTDPFDGQPLRYKRLDDGVVTYSVGADRKDDSGRLERIKIKEPDTDVGFQLWNPERRRQAR